MKFKAKKDMKFSEDSGWEDYGTIPKGTVCESDSFDRFLAIFYKGKAVCDVDSQMANDYFEEMKDE